MAESVQNLVAGAVTGNLTGQLTGNLQNVAEVMADNLQNVAGNVHSAVNSAYSLLRQKTLQVIFKVSIVTIAFVENENDTWLDFFRISLLSPPFTYFLSLTPLRVVYWNRSLIIFFTYWVMIIKNENMETQ